MKLNWMTPHRSSLGVASSVAVLVAVAGYASDHYAMVHHVSLGWDDAALGLAVGFIILVHEERRTRAMKVRLRVIRDMNSFVRNELQIINVVAQAEKDSDRMGMLQQCVDHIDWALRKLLPPNTVLEESRPLFDPKHDQVKRPA